MHPFSAQLVAESTRFSLSFSRDDGRRTIAVLEFHRAPVNAIDSVAKDELIAHARALAADPAIGALVIHGEQHFSVGDDIKEMAGAEPGYAVQGGERISEAVSAIATLPFPVIAAVRGYALGGGCELALAADFRITEETATWGLPEIHLGLIPAGGGTQRLAQLVGITRAKKLAYLGGSITGTEAADWGLADLPLPGTDARGSALRLADDLCRRAPLALRAIKRAIDTTTQREIDAGLRLESALFASMLTTGDGRSGLRSFVSEGPGKARFTGS